MARTPERRAREDRDPGRDEQNVGQQDQQGQLSEESQQDQQGQPRGPNRRTDAPKWGSYSRGNDLGPARDRSGNTGGDQYGGGGRSGSMGSPSMPWQGPPNEPPAKRK